MPSGTKRGEGSLTRGARWLLLQQLTNDPLQVFSAPGFEQPAGVEIGHDDVADHEVDRWLSGLQNRQRFLAVLLSGRGLEACRAARDN